MRLKIPEERFVVSLQKWRSAFSVLAGMHAHSKEDTVSAGRLVAVRSFPHLQQVFEGDMQVHQVDKAFPCFN